MTHDQYIIAMTAKKLTDQDIQASRERRAREMQELEAKHAAEEATILEAMRENAGEALDRILATLDQYGEFFSAAQRRKVSSYFANEGSTKTTAKSSDKGADKYLLPNGETWKGVGASVKASFAEWHKTDEGKAWVKSFLATEEGKAWQAANLDANGKIKTDKKGQPRGPFPINPAYKG